MNIADNWYKWLVYFLIAVAVCLSVALIIEEYVAPREKPLIIKAKSQTCWFSVDYEDTSIRKDNSGTWQLVTLNIYAVDATGWTDERTFSLRSNYQIQRVKSESGNVTKTWISPDNSYNISIELDQNNTASFWLLLRDYK